MTYSIYIHPKVRSKSTYSVHYPSTFSTRVYTSTTWNLSSDNPIDRIELYKDDEGRATDAEIFESCPGLRDSIANKIRQIGALKIKALTSKYTEEECKTWYIQSAEAKAWINNNDALTPMLSAIATARGVPLPELVTNVVNKSSEFEAECGAILGKQQHLINQVYSVQTVNELLNIIW